MQEGNQWPVNSTGYASEVVNIYPMVANAQAGAPEFLGWEYVMGSGGEYFEINLSYQDFWQNIVAGLPGMGWAPAFIAGGITPLNSQQTTALLHYLAAHDGEMGQACFSENLPS